MDYDNFLPQFQQCVALAGEVAAAHERYSGSSRSTFTPEIGFIPVLYIIGVKCRHPIVRREVLSILRRQLIREAAWDSISTTRVVERVIEIEEDAWEGQMVHCMSQIHVWRRIEALSYIYPKETVCGLGYYVYILRPGGNTHGVAHDRTGRVLPLSYKFANARGLMRCDVISCYFFINARVHRPAACNIGASCTVL